MIARLLLIALAVFGLMNSFNASSTKVSIWSVLAFGAIGLAGLIPFFGRKPKKPEIKSAADGRHSLHSLFPATQVYDNRASQDFESTFIQAANQGETEIVLVKVNCLDHMKCPALAILTNRRYIVYRTRTIWLLTARRLMEKPFEEVPGGKMFLLLLEPFGETYEILLRRREKFFSWVMAHDDDDLIAGKTRWHKVADVSLAKIWSETESIEVAKKIWSEGLRVTFYWAKASAIFKTNCDISIPREHEYEAYRYLASLLLDYLKVRGCDITSTENRLKILTSVAAERQKRASLISKRPAA